MGYSYGYNQLTGRQGLACDNCGTVDNVRKRQCPHKVRGDSLHSVTVGHRYELPYCPAPALCSECFRKLGGIHGVHSDACKRGAAAMQAEHDHTEARLKAGAWLVVAAYGDWKECVPVGMVGVTFRNYEHAERSFIMPKEDYNSRDKSALSDYPRAVELPERIR